MPKFSFETKLGRLEATVGSSEETEDEVTIALSFECYATGKLFELQMNEDELMKSNKLFAYDVMCVGDILKEEPAVTVSAGSKHVVVSYTVSVMKRENQIRFVVMPKQYPEGSNEEVFELKRQLRLQDRNITELTNLIHKNKLIESCRQIVDCPDNKLLVEAKEAHKIMMNQEYEYLDEKKYAAFVESKSNTTIDNIVQEFLPSREAKYVFNLHYLNRSHGLQFISCPLGNHLELEAIKSERRCNYHLTGCVKKGQEYLNFIKVVVLATLYPGGASPIQVFEQKVSERSLLDVNQFGKTRALSEQTMFIVQKLAPGSAGATPPPCPL